MYVSKNSCFIDTPSYCKMHPAEVRIIHADDMVLYHFELGVPLKELVVLSRRRILIHYAKIRDTVWITCNSNTANNYIAHYPMQLPNNLLCSKLDVMGGY